jgi:prepilin peptidase CpaA
MNSLAQSMAAPLWVLPAILLIGTLAAIGDLRGRRIPNAVTLPAMAAGLAAHLALGGPPALGSALAGLGLALALLIPGWLLKWMGAGDVKLMAAFGAWLAFPQSMIAVLAALIAGGAFAAAVAWRHGQLGTAVHGAAVLGGWSLSASRGSGGPVPTTSGIRFPFALAGLAGATIALWVRP